MSFTKLRYHIVFATKKRRPFIDQEVESALYPKLRGEFEAHDGKVIAMGGIEDHVHTILALRPTRALSDVLRDVKKESTKMVRTVFPDLAHFAWQVGYSAFTVDPFAMAPLIAYVRNQKEHHSSGDLWAEFEQLAARLCARRR